VSHGESLKRERREDRSRVGRRRPKGDVGWWIGDCGLEMVTCQL
jgi:hypothetical protein